MPDNEKQPNRVPFNPNETSNISNGRVPFNPNKSSSLSEGFAPVEYNEGGGSDNIESTLDFIQKNSKRVMRDDEKDILRDMINNPHTKKEDLSDAIVTLQGAKAKQQDNGWSTLNYYMDNVNGVYKPIALGAGEKPPKGKDVSSIWGTKKSAKDDNVFTDIAKTAFNIIPGIVGGIADLGQLGSQITTGSEIDWLKEAQNATEQLKFAKDEDIEGSIYKTDGISKFTDLFDSNRVDLSPETVWGTVLGVAGFAGEMLVPAGAVAKVARGVKVAKAAYAGVEATEGISKLAQKAAVLAGSFQTQLGSTMDASADAGLTGMSKGWFDLAMTTGLASIDAKYDVVGKIFTNKLAREAKQAVVTEAGKKIVKDEFGNITKESLNEVTAEAMKAYAPIAGSFLKHFGKDVGNEVKDEVLQAIITDSGQNIWDKLGIDEKAKFGTDAFSAKSWGNYISAAASGLVGAGAPSVISAKQAQREEHDSQSNSAYEAVKDGTEAVKALKTNLNNSFDKGDLTQAEFDNAIFKVDAYDEYHNTTKDLSLDDTNRKTLFELSLQKENLKHSIKEVESKDTKGHSRLDELNPAQLGLHNAKVKQAKALQEEIDLIVSKSEIIQQPVVSEKIVDKVVKEEEKANETPKPHEEGQPKSEFGEMMGRYNIKVPEKGSEVSVGEGTEQDKSATSKFSEYTPEDFNKKDRGHALVKKQVLGAHIKELPNQEMDAVIEEGQNQTLHLNLGDGKYIQFAQSVKLNNENAAESNDYVWRQNLPKTLETDRIKDSSGNPLRSYKEAVSIKRETIPALDEKTGEPLLDKKGNPKTKTVLNVYNKENGGHIIFVKEFEKGDSKYNKFEVPYLNKIQNKNYLTDKNTDVSQPNTASIPLTITKAIRQQLYDLGHTKKDVDGMKPEKAHEIISKQEVKVKEEKPTEKPVEQEKREPVTITPPEQSNEVAIGEGAKQVVEKPKDTVRDIMNEVYDAKPKTFDDAVLAYFASGGKLSIDSYVGETGFGVKSESGKLSNKGKKEYKAIKWALRDNAEGITTVAHTLWTERFEASEETYDDTASINAIIEVLDKYSSQQDMVQEMVSRYKKETKLETAYASDEEMRYSEEQNQKEKDANERDLSDVEVKEFTEQEQARKESDEYQADKYENLQKVSQRKGDFAKVVQVITDNFKGIDIITTDTEFNKSNVAGKLGKDGKIYLNPNYAGLDTPIHEAGHILIDLMGDNKVIKAAIEQLKTSPLWAETKERYKELSEHQLGNEVLAEAIGIEGADIFDTQVEKNKFSKYLDYIFDWFKTKLGINKNIAKSLAKQIISGIGTKNIEEVATAEDKLQKNKEEGDKKPKKAQVLGYDLYRKIYKIRNIAQEKKDLEEGKLLIDSGKLTEADLKTVNDKLASIEKIKRLDGVAYSKYKADFAKIEEISSATDLSKYTIDELAKVSNDIENLDPDAKASLGSDVLSRISYVMGKERQAEILKDPKIGTDYIETIANKKDLTGTQVNMMALSHATQDQPALQSFSKAFDSKFLDKTIEANDKKSEHEQLIRAVIKEANKKLGIAEKAISLFSSDNSKYVDYIDNGRGELLSLEKDSKGKYIDESTAKLSKPQIDYLRFVRDLITERSKQMEGGEYVGEHMNMEVIKIDKGFRETYKTEGIIEAFSYYMGGGKTGLQGVRIEYKDPITGVVKNEYFALIEKRLAQLGKKGLLEKGKALALLLHYNFKAKRQLKSGSNVDEKLHPLDVKGEAEYSLNGKGQLVSKFDKPRGEGRGYSKDFYRAVNEFIDETAHTKHMSGIATLANSIQHLAKHGYLEKGISAKPNLDKYMKYWMESHLYKQDSDIFPSDPILNSFLRKMRILTSLTTMPFNGLAQGVNIFMGNYNNWRSENNGTMVLGYSRIFGGKHKLTKDSGYGVFNSYSMDIVKKYAIANVDLDSNPRINIGTWFEKIGNAATKWGEIQIQSTLALGLMTEEEFNSFEYVTKANGTKVLEVKAKDSKGNPIDKEALKNKIISYTNRASDIQGKYGEKDRRNIMNSEIGKAVFQFKVWIPDWWKERYGAEYIDRNNVVRKGSWNVVSSKARKEFAKEIKKKGFTQAFWDSKSAMSNLKGVMVTAFFLGLKYSDDDDDRKAREASLANKMLNNILFVFDPSTLSYTVKNPIPALGSAVKLIEVTTNLMKFESKGLKSAGKGALSATPFKHGIVAFDELTKDE